MKITEYGSIKSPTGAKRKGAVSSAGAFAELLDAASAESAASTAPASDVAAASQIDNLLALQEISDDDVQKRKRIQQGKTMLDTLETLRRQILTGTVPTHTLQDLSRQISMKKQSVMDPKLMEILEDIELRAAVELAKLEQAKKPPEEG